jgi:predicted RNA binding protein YcfA (HicA-like mRNA interferase family)
MTRLPNLTPIKIVKALKRAGFVENGQKGSHCYFWHPEKKIQTCVPKHGRDVKRSLLHLIIKQAGLTKEEFEKLL